MMNAPHSVQSDSWTVAGRTFTSRLIVGTGKYKSFEENAAALEASGAEIVTVAVRRVNVSDPAQPMLTDYIDPKKVTYLPNTAGCFTAEEAIRTLRLAREAGGWNLVKLEVLGEAKTLYPDMRETMRATETARERGFRADGLLRRRSDRRETARGSGGGGDHAAGSADRLGPRHPEPRDHPPDRRRRGRARFSSTRAWGRRATHRKRWNWDATAC